MVATLDIEAHVDDVAIAHHIVPTLETLLAALSKDLLPVVPERGSVGASGDLSPLAHLAAMLIGEGDCFFEGRRLPALEGLKLDGRAEDAARKARIAAAKARGDWPPKGFVLPKPDTK